MLTENTPSENTYTNADQPNNSPSGNELAELIPIEDTPFTVVRLDKQYFLSMGKYRLSELYNTYEEATQDIHTITWNRLVQVIAIITLAEIDIHNTPTNN